MNRYPVWKYLVMGLVLILSALYTLPNFFGESPAVQISSAKAALQTNESPEGLRERVEELLRTTNLTPVSITHGDSSVSVRFADVTTQLKARDVIDHALNPDAQNAAWLVALNLVPNSPSWLLRMGASPMYLGLDLRGGVHFLLKVDLDQAREKRMADVASQLRAQMRQARLRPVKMHVRGEQIELSVRGKAFQDTLQSLVAKVDPDLEVRSVATSEGRVSVQVGVEAQKPAVDETLYNLSLTFSQQAKQAWGRRAVQQNIHTLQNRINELGVSEPVIQQQGPDKIIVQLPGLQDTAKAKEILGRTATLEMRLLCESPEDTSQLEQGGLPPNCERYSTRDGTVLPVQKEVLLTGENLTDAQAGFDSETNESVVQLRLNGQGSSIFQEVTRQNVNKRLAILLMERNKGEIVTAPVIRSEIPGGRVQISGKMNTQEAADTALLLRAGALAAPMDIVEERTIGPSLGADNIRKGLHSTFWGFVAIGVFMCLYYRVFGLISAVALSVNLLLLVSFLSLLQATLTVPGIAAIALTLGIAIDANVLINERIREELRTGASPQMAIAAGYRRAWSTILDSNVTSLIAGVALLAFGSGAVRGFAVVHCLGILTSLFSSVFFSRGVVNFIYGRRRSQKQQLSIGHVWRGDAV